MSTGATPASAGNNNPPPFSIGNAVDGDSLDGESLALLRTFLNAQIASLNEDLERETEQAAIDGILALQARIAARANELTAQSILLTAGEAKITADHIKSAVDAAQAVIEKVESINRKLTKLGAFVDFVAAVLTGSGKAIVKSAKKLKGAFDE